jgi:hypothetical protein
MLAGRTGGLYHRGVKRVARWLVTGWFGLAFAVVGLSADVESHASKVASLIGPTKLATLGPRGANSRVEKYVALLAAARADKAASKKVAARAVALVGMKGKAASLTSAAMVRNLKIADELGCLDADGLRDMQRGQAPTVQKGPYRGQELSVDHIVPRAVAPELDNVIANLELLPLKLNEGKNDKVGARQLDLARKLKKAGLLSPEGLKAVERKGESLKTEKLMH